MIHFHQTHIRFWNRICAQWPQQLMAEGARLKTAFSYNLHAVHSFEQSMTSMMRCAPNKASNWLSCLEKDMRQLAESNHSPATLSCSFNLRKMVCRNYVHIYIYNIYTQNMQNVHNASSNLAVQPGLFPHLQHGFHFAFWVPSLLFPKVPWNPWSFSHLPF